jgi:hypothetical protein
LPGGGLRLKVMGKVSFSTVSLAGKSAFHSYADAKCRFPHLR